MTETRKPGKKLMNFGQIIHTHTTASGAANAPALGTRDAGVKWATWAKKQTNYTKNATPHCHVECKNRSPRWSKRNHRQRATKLQNRHRSSIRTFTNWLCKNNNPSPKWQRKDDAVLLWWRKERNCCRIHCE